MSKSLPNKLTDLKLTSWADLVGSKENFSLESRIFHSISIGLLILNLLYIPYNFFIGLHIGALSGFIFFLVFFYQYYNSRINHKPHSNLLFGSLGIVILGANYFTNSGIVGSTDIIWPAYLLLVFAISPYKQHIIWLIVYLICFAAIHVVEYLHPEFISYPITPGKSQFIDRVTAFPIPIIAIFLVIKFMRRSYDKEKNDTLAKTIAVEKSNIEKDKLMSIISHDLKSPLVSIQNYLTLLNENEIAASDRPAIEKDLLKSTSNAMEMLSNLLLWSKSQMDGPKVQLIEIDLIKVLKNTLEMEKILASKKNITLNYQIPSPIIVIADIDMLQLVVRNLVSNAIKFTHFNGLINITAKAEGKYCKLTVEDNGAGIKEEEQDQIFSVSTKPAYGTDNEKGVGLGLVLCKEFIERQDGSIYFTSTVNEGSSFMVLIPTKVD
ncbi:sensor histidine kinase [Pedobacter cryotolerans]|uniref:histidine kinase n=1 Tax=Pedobacter cryotolerans TaxID=2571270 RepID=A0A4U1C534_9SPHI|nr:HAMP domain-containing sensor histidine kinase [Pedobacter cryotolerans]TKB99300.1 HAMP domain-containing histidine kinase [Pedobacter cryotolerans]